MTFKHTKVESLIKPNSFIQLKDHHYKFDRQGRDKTQYGANLPTFINDESKVQIRKYVLKYWSKGTNLLVHRLTDYLIDFTCSHKGYDDNVGSMKVVEMRMELSHFIYLYTDKIKTIDFKEV